MNVKKITVSNRFIVDDERGHLLTVQNCALVHSINTCMVRNCALARKRAIRNELIQQLSLQQLHMCSTLLNHLLHLSNLHCIRLHAA